MNSENTTVLLDPNLIDTLLLRIGKQDKDALSSLYEQIDDAVYGYAISILKNSHEAEDVLHDTFLSIWSSAHSYVSAGKPMAWIFTIARNHCLMKQRKNSNTADLPEEDWEKVLTEKASSVDDRLVLESCIKELTKEDREIVLLYVLGGLKHREIADLLKMPLSTVLSKYRRSLEKLRNSLGEGNQYEPRKAGK